MQLGEVGVAKSCAESRGLDPWLVPGECGGPWGSMFPQRAVWSPTVTSLATLCSILFFWQKEGKKTHTNSWKFFFFCTWHLPCALCWSNLLTKYTLQLEGWREWCQNWRMCPFMIPPFSLSLFLFFFVFFFPQLQFLYILTYFPLSVCHLSKNGTQGRKKRLHT